MKKIIIIISIFIISISSSLAQSSDHDYRMGKAMEIWMNLFRDINLFYVDTTSPEGLLKSAADGMIEGLDPYTEYIPENKMADFESQNTGKYGGIGSLIRQRGEWVEISEPYRGSPADLAGLKAGDRLMKIDQTDLRGAGSEKVSSMLKGAPNTKFQLTYAPITDTLNPRTVEMRRQTIQLPSVPYSGVVGQDIGYISLDGFTENCSQEVRTALEELIRKDKIKGLILDLRSNGGGSVGEAVKIAGLFLPRSTDVVSLKGRIKEYNQTFRTTDYPISTDLPLVILQSSSSASSSEILAGALQDLDRAVIMGSRSFGKGLVQSPRPVGYNSFLKITTAKYYTPSGRCIQALDYSHRREDGSVGQIPDSLIHEFKTRAGRKVYNGGGINPDVKLETEYLSKFSAILLAYGFIDDFANLYAAKNTPSKEFEVTPDIYQEFVEMMRDKTIEYQSATAMKLKELKTWAEREKYDDRLKEEFAAIERKIAEDKMGELKTFEKEIRNILTESIIQRWFYNAGRAAYSLKSDTEVQSAIKLLEDTTEYQRILKEQDTNKN